MIIDERKDINAVIDRAVLEEKYLDFLEKSKFKNLLKTGVSVPRQSSGYPI